MASADLLPTLPARLLEEVEVHHFEALEGKWTGAVRG